MLFIKQFNFSQMTLSKIRLIILCLHIFTCLINATETVWVSAPSCIIFLVFFSFWHFYTYIQWHFLILYGLLKKDNLNFSLFPPHWSIFVFLDARGLTLLCQTVSEITVFIRNHSSFLPVMDLLWKWSEVPNLWALL